LILVYNGWCIGIVPRKFGRGIIGSNEFVIFGCTLGNKISAGGNKFLEMSISSEVCV
jgi:hypothetical protein